MVISRREKSTRSRSLSLALSTRPECSVFPSREGRKEKNEGSFGGEGTRASTQIKIWVGAQIGGSEQGPSDCTARLGGAHLPGAAWAPCVGRGHQREILESWALGERWAGVGNFPQPAPRRPWESRAGSRTVTAASVVRVLLRSRA
jgi:hypothetical protein